MSKKLFRSKTDPYPLAARIFAQLRDLDENEGWYGECLVNILMFCTVAINLDRLDGDAHVLIANAYLLTAFRAAQKDNRELYTGNMMRCAAVIYEWKTNPKMISREREMGEKIYREVMSGDLDPKPAFQNKEIYHLAVPDLSDADIQSKEDKFSDAERLYRVWHLVRNQGIPLAIRNLQLGLTESPNNPTFHALLGNLYSWLRLYDEAEGEFRTVKRLDPKHDVHLPVATVYLAQNKLDKAISEFEVSLRIEPKNWDAHFLLARSYHKKGRLKDALREYRIFVQNDESKPKAITHSLIGEISY